jgi:hypothetical protein
MDAKNFRGLKKDYIALYDALGMVYRGESVDEMKFKIMSFASTVKEDDVKDIKTVAAPKEVKRVKKATVTPVDSKVFSHKVTYDEEEGDEEIIPIPIPKPAEKAKAKAKAPASKAKATEPPVEEAPKVRMSWNEFITSKAKENPGMNRKELMVKFSGDAWKSYKASFE